jgi:hypothetical protein
MLDNTASTIFEFCRRKKISKAKYFAMRREGRGPREMRDGRWVRISVAAERDWEHEREAENANTNTTEPTS